MIEKGRYNKYNKGKINISYNNINKINKIMIL